MILHNNSSDSCDSSESINSSDSSDGSDSSNSSNSSDSNGIFFIYFFYKDKAPSFKHIFLIKKIICKKKRMVSIHEKQGLFVSIIVVSTWASWQLESTFILQQEVLTNKKVFYNIFVCSGKNIKDPRE